MTETTPQSSADADGAYPPGALEHLQRADSVIGGLIERFGMVTRERNRPPFYALMTAIVSQQISVKAAAAIMARLLALFPAGRDADPAALAEMPIEQLRAAGLSAAKARYMHDLAEKIHSRAVDLDRLAELPDEAVIDTLCQVKGIGRWTAEVFLIFSLGRLDVLAADDLGLRASVRHNYQLDHLPGATELRALAEPWRPYRTIATIYLWESLHNR